MTFIHWRISNVAYILIFLLILVCELFVCESCECYPESSRRRRRSGAVMRMVENFSGSTFNVAHRDALYDGLVKLLEWIGFLITEALFNTFIQL
uniref:Uncharacterized protein n=1 Tax=Lepeophtheirus salmonis TaxID=72036 RepID=A0A0K2U8L9_LEPSM